MASRRVVPSVTSQPLGAARVFCAALPEFDITATQLGSVFGSASRITGVHDRVKSVYAALDRNRVTRGLGLYIYILSTLDLTD